MTRTRNPIAKALRTPKYKVRVKRSKRAYDRARVVELASAQELELAAVKGVPINLPVIELDRANGLRGREQMTAALAQAKIAEHGFVLCQPTCECR